MERKIVKEWFEGFFFHIRCGAPCVSALSVVDLIQHTRQQKAPIAGDVPPTAPLLLPAAHHWNTKQVQEKEKKKNIWYASGKGRTAFMRVSTFSPVTMVTAINHSLKDGEITLINTRVYSWTLIKSVYASSSSQNESI